MWMLPRPAEMTQEREHDASRYLATGREASVFATRCQLVKLLGQRLDAEVSREERKSASRILATA